MARISLRRAREPQRPDWLAGAPGFEPGNGGIKIRCLTTWLRPNLSQDRRARYSGVIAGDQCLPGPPAQTHCRLRGTDFLQKIGAHLWGKCLRLATALDWLSVRLWLDVRCCGRQVSM